MRLQKYLSAAGVCSRREAEKRIESGRVTVNGVPASLGMSAEENDTVLCDGVRVVLPGEHRYVLLHKPRGYLTTLSDDRGRPTVAELVADAPCRLFPVGRLDYDSEGLLLMTDDGDIAQRLAHPSHGVEKVYHVWVSGMNGEAAAEALRRSITVEGVTYSAREVTVLSVSGRQSCLAITLAEGKNREIRRMCEASGLRVHRLRRVSQGELRLGTLPVGKWRYLNENELRYLRSLQ